MQLATLENDFFSICISSHGAELHSIYSKKLDKELLWSGYDKVWARHAPVLFPIVGKLKNDSYTFNGKGYSLPQHGFARDMDFRIVSNIISDDFHAVVYELDSDATTLEKYPFSFALQIEYKLENEKLHCNHKVKNTSDTEMYFSIGSHPGFVCPLMDGEQLSDYTISFEKEEIAPRNLLDGGLFNGTQEEVIVNKKHIPLSKELFEKDAIVLKELNSQSLQLHSNNNTLNFFWHNMSYFGIWAKKGNEEFICLEPWAGLADSTNASGNIKEKEGIITLSPTKVFECGFGISV
jgi:galactose mutarotase-like enzyme